jgi:hypothetical protein
MKLSVFLQAHRTYHYNERTGSPIKNGLCDSPLFILLSPLFILLNAQFQINHNGT